MRVWNLGLSIRDCGDLVFPTQVVFARLSGTCTRCLCIRNDDGYVASPSPYINPKGRKQRSRAELAHPSPAVINYQPFLHEKTHTARRTVRAGVSQGSIRFCTSHTQMVYCDRRQAYNSRHLQMISQCIRAVKRLKIFTSSFFFFIPPQFTSRGSWTSWLSDFKPRE
ncbi:hypothetical protein EVAR_61492_1 [Eumeta japonica]|uniref:Uncharacterized protein n=1 Tax=Eumeta variegata TaxID=151549 RepID=A0A4C1ZJ56_EUMVA|nr:hypothetical protein EVAR_61492_1 [Eumeta japonica]